MNTKLPPLPDCFSTTVAHATFQSARNKIQSLLRYLNKACIIVVVGPTGIGKSTLAKVIQEDLTKMAESEMRENPNMIPYAYHMVHSPALKSFSWKDTHISLLEELKHPFTDVVERNRRTKAWEQVETPEELSPVSAAALSRLTNKRLFAILAKTTAYRKPKAILLDEAHHLIRTPSEKVLLDQLEHLKYSAEVTQTPHILLGTYQLQKLLDLNGALIRRRAIVHVPRYALNPLAPKESMEDFADAVAEFNVDLAPFCKVDLLEIVPELYAGCVGCVGILRDWLHRAWVAAMETRGRRITTRILDDTVMSVPDRTEILKEAENGERYFVEREGDEQALLRRLGFINVTVAGTAPDADKQSSETIPANDESEPDASNSSDEVAAEIPKAPRRKTRVGKRKPHRDPVGIDAKIRKAKKG